MKDGPAFQLYAADFYMDTVEWSSTQVGIYFRLLMYEWVNGVLPNDEKRLARIAGTDPGNFKKAWVQDIAKKFSPNGDGNLINRRMEEVRLEQQEYRKSQREAGLRGVEVKKKKGIFPFDKSSDPSSDPLTNPASENQALLPSSSSSIKDKKRKNIKKEILNQIQQESFNVFWKAYPYKKSIGQAEKAWKKINPDPELLATMILKIEKAKTSQQWTKDNGEFIPHPATWLNAKGWEDEEVEIIGESQGTRMVCKECGDDSQHVSIGDDGLCALCRGKQYEREK